jgi:hypothetical protein
MKFYLKRFSDNCSELFKIRHGKLKSSGKLDKNNMHHTKILYMRFCTYLECNYLNIYRNEIYEYLKQKLLRKIKYIIHGRYTFAAILRIPR